MPLELNNTLTNRIERFEALNPPLVTFYSCGPTVYDFAHIGNFRSFLAADVLRRYLDFSGYRVRHVMNITDVGHMVDDTQADGGGLDKMEAARLRLKESKKSGALPEGAALDPDDPYAIANFYADAFIQDGRALGLQVVFDAERDPTLLPRPTRYIEAMIDLVRTLIARGYAYVGADGVVYFDVQSFPRYGELSGNTPERIRSGAGGRVDEATQATKKHPADFMLWKPDPAHLMRWPSPWGEGYPGWHLECSVMADRLLGRDTGGVIDLHSGGEDNIFPHHECEIAQTCAAHGVDRFARFWFHPRFLLVEGEKMSKSKGNFYTPRDLFAMRHAPAALRLELIKTHYRSNANFTMQGLKDSARIIARWRQFVEAGEAPGAAGAKPAADLAAIEADFRAAMDSDLNVAGALGVVNKWIGSTSAPSPADAELMRRFDRVFGVLSLRHEADNQVEFGVDTSRIDELLRERTAARASKDFARADSIRDELAAMGIDVKDSPSGPTWSRRIGG